MDNEKFDQILKDRVHKFDQEYSPAFNEHRVWNGVKKNNTASSWFAIVAACVIIIIGLSILFQQYNRPLEMARIKRWPLESVKSLETRSAKPAPQEMVIYTKVKKEETLKLTPEILPVLNNINRPLVPIRVSDNLFQSADSTQAVTVKLAEPSKDTIIELPLAVKDPESEIRVTFKRGNSIKVALPPESKLSFKKFKLRISQNQVCDTSAYALGAEAESGRKFRIKF